MKTIRRSFRLSAIATGSAHRPESRECQQQITNRNRAVAVDVFRNRIGAVVRPGRDPERSKHEQEVCHCDATVAVDISAVTAAPCAAASRPSGASGAATIRNLLETSLGKLSWEVLEY